MSDLTLAIEVRKPPVRQAAEAAKRLQRLRNRSHPRVDHPLDPGLHVERDEHEVMEIVGRTQAVDPPAVGVPRIGQPWEGR